MFKPINIAYTIKKIDFSNDAKSKNNNPAMLHINNNKATPDISFFTNFVFVLLGNIILSIIKIMEIITERINAIAHNGLTISPSTHNKKKALP